MSADNAIYYRQIGDKWYVMEGVDSCDRTNDDYLRYAARFDSRPECLEAAANLADSMELLEYGICSDPEVAGDAIKIIPWAGQFLCAECCRAMGHDERKAQFAMTPYMTGVKCERCGESRTCYAVSAKSIAQDAPGRAPAPAGESQ